MKEMDPEDEQVQLQVRKLQDYITDHFYTCSDKILCGLGRMYAGGGELTEILMMLEELAQQSLQVKLLIYFI